MTRVRILAHGLQDRESHTPGYHCTAEKQEHDNQGSADNSQHLQGRRVINKLIDKAEGKGNGKMRR